MLERVQEKKMYKKILEIQEGEILSAMGSLNLDDLQLIHLRHSKID